MAITFPVDIPLSNVADVSFQEMDTSSFQTSPFTGRGRLQQYEGEWWEVTLGYRNLDRALAQEVLGFISSLRGPVGTFVLPFPGYSQPRGTAATVGSSPTVNGSAQAGSAELVVQSSPISQTGWLLTGDIIQVGPASRPRWHRVLQDVDTDGSGNATIDVWPYIRDNTISGDPVSFSSPLCLFRKVDVVQVSMSSPVIHNFDIICRESI